MSASKKILGIQYLRGLAALGVVFCHYGADPSLNNSLYRLFIFGQTGIFVFFLISGFIIVYSLMENNYRPRLFLIFLLKRSIRIDPPYWAVIGFTICLNIALNHLSFFKGSKFDFSIGQLFAHLLYIVPFTKYSFYNHVFWTLCIEFQFYVLIGLLFFISVSKHYQIPFLIIFSLLSFINMPNGYNLALTYSPIFSTGIGLLYFYKSKKKADLILPVFFLMIVGFKFGALVCILLMVSGCVVLFVTQPIPVLKWLGDISYSLYLTHQLVLFLLTGCLRRMHIDSGKNISIWLLPEIVLSLVIAYLFFILIEKRALRFSKLVSYK